LKEIIVKTKVQFVPASTIHASVAIFILTSTLSLAGITGDIVELEYGQGYGEHRTAIVGDGVEFVIAVGSDYYREIDIDASTITLRLTYTGYGNLHDGVLQYRLSSLDYDAPIIGAEVLSSNILFCPPHQVALSFTPDSITWEFPSVLQYLTIPSIEYYQNTEPREVQINVSTLPEPSTLLLLGLGAVMVRRKR